MKTLYDLLTPDAVQAIGMKLYRYNRLLAEPEKMKLGEVFALAEYHNLHKPKERERLFKLLLNSIGKKNPG